MYYNETTVQHTDLQGLYMDIHYIYHCQIIYHQHQI